MFASLSSLGVHVSGGVVSGRGLPHGSSGVFSTEVVDVDQESVAMGSNHVPHFLIIETLILLQPHTHTHTHTHTREREREKERCWRGRGANIRRHQGSPGTVADALASLVRHPLLAIICSTIQFLAILSSATS